MLLLLLSVFGPSCCGQTPWRLLPQNSREVPEIEKSFLFITHQFTQKLCREEICLEGPLRVIAGSGFSVALSGSYTWVVTAAHLCLPSNDIVNSQMVATGLGGVSYSAVVRHAEPSVDLCFLTIQGAAIPPVVIADKDVSRGERVLALGSPLGLFDSNMIPKFEGFYAGSTTEIQRPDDPSKKFPTLDGFTVPARPGSSGGPIFNASGELVGVMRMAKPDFETFTLSPPQALVRTLLASVQRNSERLISPELH